MELVQQVDLGISDIFYQEVSNAKSADRNRDLF